MATPRCSVTLLRLIRQDDGIGLVLVIGISAMMAILLAVISATAIRSLGSSSDHVNFEQSLAAAEAGIDSELSKVQAARNQVPSVNYESPLSCRPAAPGASVFTSEDAEKSWARASLNALPTSCTQANGQGDYVAFKVPGRQMVYSLGWSPSRGAANAQERLLKVEYIFAPYRPGQAVLTGGRTNLQGSVEVSAVAGLPADVHSNENVTVTGSGLTVSGSVTASGSVADCPSAILGGCQSSQPKERIPVANPRAVYTDYATTTGQWYDLCPGGEVKAPSSGGPCTGDFIDNSPYRGWYWSGESGQKIETWTLQNTGTSYLGAYYVYGADAVVGAQGNSQTTQTVSVLAESISKAGYTNAATCDKYGGNITWSLFDIQNYLRGVLFIAQGSLDGNANSTAQAGLMLAGDKVDLQSKSAEVMGSIIANNTCAAAGTNNLSNMKITYDDSVEAPVYSVVNTTLWLEYVG